MHKEADEELWINVCSIELYELNQSYMNRLIYTVTYYFEL